MKNKLKDKGKRKKTEKYEKPMLVKYPKTRRLMGVGGMSADTTSPVVK